MKMGEIFTQLGSIIATLMFMRAILERYAPPQLKAFLEKHFTKAFNFLSPYIQITFNEFTGERLMRSEAYSAIETYLSSISSAQARRMKADVLKNSSHPLVLTMDDNEEVADAYKGVKIWWASGKIISKVQTLSFQHMINDEKRYYTLKFHKKDRDFVIKLYLDHVMKEGKAIRVKNRQRKLYTNNGPSWSHVLFEHPATFQTLAMDLDKKRDIVDDLLVFSYGEGFYSRIGRAWKRGYLLYGPPGTGKSTMIAAMANLLRYDVYDLELTSVKDNTELKKLLISASSKSIVVIEDIDCSADLTGQRGKKRDKKEHEQEEPADNAKNVSKVTLSGLLNFIDGLWSACGGERLIVFTTNHVEKLDPALIRRGRMDKHIELSYCSFEGFKILARNYLGLEHHDLFGRIEVLLGEIKITPADVAENLMPKGAGGNVETCLKILISVLEQERDELYLD
ncbi:AAA-ATPase ASD, mitochondrial-like [Primulina huaijiensis]|uniref:AAA-ATPase ASD, mitochondrial-like n=1 Tax=Primulina huaijiensis TaxID=1492673 RepID=UPI003CC7510B